MFFLCKIIMKKQDCSEWMYSIIPLYTPCLVLCFSHFIVFIATVEIQSRVVLGWFCSSHYSNQQLSNWNQFTHKPQRAVYGSGSFLCLAWQRRQHGVEQQILNQGTVMLTQSRFGESVVRPSIHGLCWSWLWTCSFVLLCCFGDALILADCTEQSSGSWAGNWFLASDWKGFVCCSHV